MDLQHVFEIDASPTEAYEIKLLSAATFTETDGKVEVDLGWGGFIGSGDSQDDALMDAIKKLRERWEDVAVPYVRAHGTQIDADVLFERRLVMFRQRTMRIAVDDDEVYDISPYDAATIDRGAEAVTVSATWSDLTASGPSLVMAAETLWREVKARVGTVSDPGDLWDAAVELARSEGTRVAADVLAKERADAAAYEAAKEKITSITPDDIDAISREGKPLLVDFWAPWCGPCRALAPFLADAADERAARLNVRKINVDDHEGANARFGIKGIPTLIAYRDGDEIGRIVGFGGREQLVASIDEILERS